jgi:hypothetical protein
MMEELKHGEVVKTYGKDPEELLLMEKMGLPGIKVEVDEDYKAETVILTVGQQNVVMTLRQARDLALELRQAANRVEKATLARLGKRRK